MPRSNRDAGGEAVGDLAIVLHSHMPYVEGFGTYPFGEEWLFDAVGPLLPAGAGPGARPDGHRDAGARRPARGAGGGGADAGVPAPLPARGRRARRRRRRRELRLAAEGEAERYRRSLARLEDLEGDVLARVPAGGRAKRRAAAVVGHPRGPAAGGHRRRPAPSDRRRAALAPAPLRARGGLLASRVRLPPRDRAAAGRARPAVLLHRPERSRAPPRRAGAGRAPVRGSSAFTLDWEAVELVWAEGGYPSDPSYADFHRASMHGNAPVGDRRGSLRPGGGARSGRAPRRVIRRRGRPSGSRAFRERRDAPGLVTFAIDTELLGHWWWEGPGAGWRAVLRLGPERGIRLVTLPQALERHVAEERPLRGVDLGRGQGPSHLGLAGGRRPRLGRAAAGAPPAARRSSRTGSPRRPPSGRRASCSRSRRATGRSSIAASRPATIRTSAPRPTRGRCSKPYTPASRRTPACETWRPTSASSRCSSPEQLIGPWRASSSSPGSTRR